MSPASPHLIQYVLLSVDQFMVFCAISPLVILFWRGTWQLQDFYFLPSDDKGSAWISFAVGNIGMLLLVFLAPVLQRLKTDRLCSVQWVLGYHLYTYIGGCIAVSSWRGIWKLLDIFTGMTIASNSASVVIGLGALYLLRASRVCCTPPGLCVMDTEWDLVDYTTRFDTKPSSLEHYILDSVLTSVGIHNLVVLFWRGSWGLLDLLLYPEDSVTSSTVCLIVAADVFVALIPVQILLLHHQKVFHGQLCWRILLDDILFLVASCICVLQWRGLWYLCNVYILPDSPEISNWTTHIVGYVGLSLLLCSASNMMKGCCKDGGSLEEPTYFILDNRYVRYFLDKRKLRNISEIDTDGAINYGFRSEQPAVIGDMNSTTGT